jgi:hypothetical protein
MEPKEPNAEELVVKTQYFLPIEPSEDNLRAVQNRLTQIMMEEGYHTDDVPLPFVTLDRTMEFIKVPPPGKKTRWDKLKEQFGFGGNDNPQERLSNREDFLEGLKRLVDDIPFRIVFRFKTFRGQETQGYDLFLESTPALLQKSRQLQLHPDYSYNIDNVVDQNKREIRRILGCLELEPVRGPYTEAEKLGTRLSEATVEELEEHPYGQTAVKYINEGDKCFQKNLLHAALSCYIQGIEWVVLHYKVTESKKDFVEQQQNGEIGPVYFSDLVDELDDSAASQKIISKLENLNRAERRWMAHHKSGELQRQDVENVRSTLLRLSEELL